VADFKTTGLWLRTLSEQAEETAASARELLRGTLLGFRDRAKFLANEIARDLPEFTNHDITHLDALWELADLICGPAYRVTPTDAFVLGGAFLIHDLGMGLAAYPGGINELKQQSIWRDTLTARMREKLGREPKPEELTNPPSEFVLAAKAETLRYLHAARAENLALSSWQDAAGGQTYHLIDNPDIRAIYGKLIGRIAHSHWWPVSKLKQEFRELLGAPSFAPNDWTVDPLKMAAILRVADISHLDDRRAAGFARAVRSPASSSRPHWIFQEHLQKPQLRDGRLVFTSSRPFPLEESGAWWLCFETLQDVDRELQRTDALLADESRERFAARGVAGIEDPARLTERVPTDGWLPVSALVRVSNVARLVRTLGGEALYGPDQTVPLRELIQNAADAVRARRILDDQPAWGRIAVRMGTDTEGSWIEVEDDGVGMSGEVLCGALLDFGSAYWGSPRMIRDFPGLLSKGFTSIGTYGIGFFSVFMWGDHVRVTTRRFEDARKDTKVLEFDGGPESRAVLRPATTTEFLRDGGSRVRVWLSRNPTDVGGILNSKHRRSEYSLEQLCCWLAPALEVDLFVSREDGSETKVIGASDWKAMSPEDLLSRVLVFNSDMDDERSQMIVRRLCQNMRPFQGSSGEIIGRACVVPYLLIPGFHGFMIPGGFPGAVTVGGLRSMHFCRFAGFLEGKAITASRHEAVPLVRDEELTRWASEQASLLPSLTKEPEYLIEAASVIIQCGGDPKDLPIVLLNSQPLSRSQLAALTNLPDELVLLSDDSYRHLTSTVPDLKLDPNVCVISRGD